jgi:hypothetical protein
MDISVDNFRLKGTPAKGVRCDSLSVDRENLQFTGWLTLGDYYDNDSSMWGNLTESHD